MSKKIFVIDDEPEIAQFLKFRLETKGYEVIVSHNGKEGLERAKTEYPDLIISDVMMPQLNGYQLCRTLKDDPAFKHIPIILLTAKVTKSDQFWGVEAGADEYLTKPYNAEDLLEKVSKLLGT